MRIDFSQKTSPYQELLDIIHRFKASTFFFHWLANEEIIVKVLKKHLDEKVYEGILEYYLDEIKIFSVGGQYKCPPKKEKIHLHGTHPETAPPVAKFYFYDKAHFVDFVPDLNKMEKIELSHTLDDSNYTVISELFLDKNLVGSIWEIYDLPNLLKVYQARKEKLIH
ncbi:MAG: hypothetical protein ABSA17_06335 [Rhabdochlamydiaceae bacterium]